mmetsp:Transcript_3874/g.5414  ORF Transcript_3874/g.5414 Transcript_3874/m.5414 type:complete len:93 (-) Transcript_3874:383-661(-)
MCCPPGPKCALCCTVFSIWGVVILSILTILWAVEYEKLDPKGDVDDKQNAAVSSGIAAAIYFLFAAGCGWRLLILNRRASKNKDQYVFDNDD